MWFELCLRGEQQQMDNKDPAASRTLPNLGHANGHDALHAGCKFLDVGRERFQV